MTPADLLNTFKTPLPVLDHGFVRLVDAMGGDERIEEVARVSYDGARKRSERRGLLRFLMRHRHTSPFEQAVITLDIKLPIFVARQLVRHRTQSLNEVSARYTELPEVFYIPEGEQVCYQSSDNKQGRSGPLPEEDGWEVIAQMNQLSTSAFAAYHQMLAKGVARETARAILPLNTYTHWYTTMNVHNMLHMLSLRMDPHAQWEIRQYADAIAQIIRTWVPLTWEAFEDYRLGAVTISRQELAYLREVCAMHKKLCLDPTGTSVQQDVMAIPGQSAREALEFIRVFYGEAA